MVWLANIYIDHFFNFETFKQFVLQTNTLTIMVKIKHERYNFKHNYLKCTFLTIILLRLL